ncbi:MAG: hypothetical protein V4649_11155 [Bacteroidota bacterium]
MNIYKIIFAKNEIIACQVVSNTVALEGNCYYEQDRGQMIFAIVKAADERDARRFANNIISEVSDKVFGREYIL